ncbi:hypothetical protein MHYP_G00128960 [Metynnis hypsauchen]
MVEGPCFPPDHHLSQRADGRPQEVSGTHLLARPELHRELALDEEAQEAYQCVEPSQELHRKALEEQHIGKPGLDQDGEQAQELHRKPALKELW